MKKLFLVLAASAAMFLTSCTAVDSGEVGIKFSKFSVDDQGELKATPCSGFTFFNPFTTDVFTYPVFIQRKDYAEFSVTTKDAAQFTMDPDMAYQLDKGMAIYVFKKYRKPLPEIENGYMRTCIYDAYRIVANRYTSDSLMASRARFEGEVRTILDSTLSKEGL